MAAALARVYQRSAYGYVGLFYAVFIPVILLYTAGAVWIFARYFEIDGTALGWFMLAGLSGPIIGLAIGVVVVVRKEADVRKWLTGAGTPEEAIAAWNGLAGLPMRLVPRSAAIIAAITTPLLTLASLHTGLGTDAWAFLMIGQVFLNLGCASFGLILLDIFMRPIRTSIDRALPRDFRPKRPAGHMHRRITVELFLLIFSPSILTAGILAPAGGGIAGFGRLIVVGALVTALFAILGQAFVEKVSGPVRDLLDGTRAVTAGDLAARVPLTSTDAHLALTDSFNSMVAGLRERQALHSAMGSYIDPTVAERVMREGAMIRGEAADVTVMFVDIVGYTALAENASAEEVVSDLNEFFDLVVPTILKEGGHVNKLLGDGLMAVFGVPLEVEDHAERALAAAQAIDRALLARYDGRVRVGIGLNSGTVVAGTMGGGTKLDYTIIGDVVNVASRVEAMTRVTGDAILMTDSTAGRLVPDRELSYRGVRALKGRATAVGLWALCDPLPGAGTAASRPVARIG